MLLQTIEEVIKIGNGFNSLQPLFNGRVHLKGIGWTNIELKDKLKETLITGVTDALNCRNSANTNRIINNLTNNPQEFSKYMNRLHLCSHTNEVKYCAGQSYPCETKYLRRVLGKK